jgi:large subunit ribosomal protein L15
MKLHNLAPAEGARSSEKRLGRGRGSGIGKTSGKGMKGQNSRSGGGVRPGFEGGQMPLTRRLPKRGFNNYFKKDYTIVNLSDLDKFDNGSVVDLEALKNKGIVKKIASYGIKVLAQGTLTKKLTVKADKFSEAAEAAITAAGGKAEVI